MQTVIAEIKRTGEEVIMVDSEYLGGEPMHKVLHGKEMKWFRANEIKITKIDGTELRAVSAKN